MSDSLKIKISRHLHDDLYIDDIIELKPTTNITPWGADNFIWEGGYQGKKSLLIFRDKHLKKTQL
ncbi:MAG: hypothetical protein QNK89_10315 [Lacinutrix sp.]|uniref:hypothetical protein n=1 Tax=Lacinutrix sp. TaxID=1937692 RepID=UPI0030B4DF72